MEHQNIEWKSMWKDDYLAWICGFANAGGDILCVGFDDTGTPVGVTNSKKFLEDLPNKIRDAMGIIPDIRLIEIDGRRCIEIHISAYPFAISCKGSYYVRSGGTNQKLTGPALEDFILRRRGISWEAFPLPSFTIEDLDDGA